MTPTTDIYHSQGYHAVEFRYRMPVQQGMSDLGGCVYKLFTCIRDDL